MKTEIELNKALVEKYVQKFMQADLTSSEASMCKLASSEMQGKVADRCVQLFGGYGYMKEYKISRAYLDAKFEDLRRYTEIMKELISKPSRALAHHNSIITRTNTENEYR